MLFNRTTLFRVRCVDGLSVKSKMFSLDASPTHKSPLYKIICEFKRALYGIKCALRIFLTNMAEHTIEEKKFDAL